MASASFDITPPWRNTRAPTSNVAGKFPNEMSMEMNNNIYKSLINGGFNGKNYLSGWWYTYPSEKYEFVSWDDDIPNIWKVIKKMFQTTNQLMGLSPIN